MELQTGGDFKVTDDMLKSLPEGIEFDPASGIMKMPDSFFGDQSLSADRKTWTEKVQAFLNNLYNLKGPELLVFISMFALALMLAHMLYSWLNSGEDSVSSSQSNSKEEEEAETEPLRDFSLDQLRQYDGSDLEKPIYVALKGEVFDVSSGKDFYGQGQAYNCFAGRDATRAMAKLSFEEEHLNNPNSDDLNALEKSNLDDWYEKFKYYKGYPVRGKVSIPPEPKPFSLTELATYKGDQEVLPTRVDAAIYLGIKGKVIDVSYGGKEMYGKGGPYHIFAGIDASVALAKMSFDEKDLNDRDTSLLTSDQLKVLDDWEKKFLNARCYPVVGFIAS